MVPPLTTDETSLVKSARTFAAEHITPHAADWELNRTVPVETFRQAARAGLAGVLVPKALGGHGARSYLINQREV